MTARHILSDTERRDWLRLSRTDNIGPITFHTLLGRYRSIGAVLENIPRLAAQGGRTRALKLPSPAEAEDEIARHEKFGARLIACCEPDYPAPLSALEDAPPLISIRGNADCIAKTCIAIVGARNASINGKKMAEMLAQELGAANVTVVSGMARGIDTAAHNGSLSTGTAAVLAGGIDNIYPEENRALYQRIMETGCIVAEMPLGSEPRAQHFPRRNRIISGLSLGVVVIEAAIKSGSLITANRALEQGREVYAVPGSPLDPRCQGTNNLIKQGATLVESVQDILANLPKDIRVAEPEQETFVPPPAPLDEDELLRIRDQLIENLSPSPVAVDELIRQCHLSPPLVLTALLELELAGRAQRLPGNKVMLVA
ncbi:MAG: DNA-protecting protein DprA [Alphaproteobacteria bacterium]|nr:DNA-protecting protein DprA [Alphaproteobacteria bacterium]